MPLSVPQGPQPTDAPPRGVPNTDCHPKHFALPEIAQRLIQQRHNLSSSPIFHFHIPGLERHSTGAHFGSSFRGPFREVSLHDP